MKANAERNNETPSCASVAPLLTALFDGEADQQSAQTARAHLLTCERCARAWLDWNQNRSILLNESIPAPPPTLLWRVLLACRLASFAQSKKAARASKALPRENSLFPDPVLPGDLSARILAQTTRREQPVPISYGTTRKTSRFRWRLAAWPTLAMPALAAWMILIGQNSPYAPIESPIANETGLTSSTVDGVGNAVSSTGEVVATAPQNPEVVRKSATPRATKNNIVTSTKSVLKSVAKAVATDSVTKATPFVAPIVRQEREVESEKQERRAVEPRIASPRIVQTSVTRNTESRSTERRGRVVSNEAIARQHEARIIRVDEEVAKRSVPKARPVSLESQAPEVSPKVRTVVARTADAAKASFREVGRGRLRSATLSDEINSPRSRVARPVLASFSADDNTSLRPSRPVSRPIQSAPRFASLETADSAEEHVEEMRSWVDGFRSSFNYDDNLDLPDSDAG